MGQLYASLLTRLRNGNHGTTGEDAADEIGRLQARLSLAERSIQEFKADRSEVIDGCIRTAAWHAARGATPSEIINAIAELKDQP